MMQRKKVIIDCDPGHDDAAAIILAVRSPELELIGITCVAGNVEVEKTSMNALKLCGLAGIRKVPVVRGMAKPLFGELRTASAVHGKSGLDGVILPPTDLQFHPGHAVDFLIETLLTSNNDITLIPTAPLTNIAMAMLREPRIIPRIAQIVLMGGAMGLGNVTPSAEFNIHTDPEAAKVVFESGAPILMVGLDATHKAPLRQEHLALISRHGTPVSEALTSMFRFYLGAIQKLGVSEWASLHDACAVAAVCDPSLIKTQLMRVDIETTGEFTRGRTVCDPYLAHGRPPNVHVGIDFDADRFFAMLIERLK